MASYRVKFPRHGARRSGRWPACDLTGAASPRGLGKATARLLASVGATVAIVDIDGEAAEQAARELGEGHIGYALDVTDDSICKAVTARVSVEAGATPLWRSIVGDTGRSVGIDHFGASADYKTLFEKFGITTEAVVAAARETLADSAN